MRRIALAAVLIACGVSAANGQNCQQLFYGPKLNAAAASNLQLLNQLDAQERQCYANAHSRPTPMPRFDPQYHAPQQNDIYNNPVMREFESLGERTMRGQPLRQNIPLSSGVVRQEIYVPPPPSNYVDPFARQAPSPPSNIQYNAPAPSVRSNPAGNNFQSQSTMRPPANYVDPFAGKPTPSTTFINPKGCTFDSPACR